MCAAVIGAVGTMMGRSSAAEICCVGPFAGRTG